MGAGANDAGNMVVPTSNGAFALAPPIPLRQATIGISLYVTHVGECRLAIRVLCRRIQATDFARRLRGVHQLQFPHSRSATLGAPADIYGLQVAAAHAELSLASFFVELLGRPARVGDIVALGPIALLAHQVEGGRVTTVGLRLAEPQAPETWSERLALWRDKARRLLG